MRGAAALWRDMRRGGVALWVSGLCWAVMFTAFMVALTLTTVANVLVTMAMAPLVTALFARVFLQPPAAGAHLGRDRAGRRSASPGCSGARRWTAAAR